MVRWAAAAGGCHCARASDPGGRGHGRGSRLYRQRLHCDRGGQCRGRLQADADRGELCRFVSSSWFTGIPANYLAPSMRRAGLVPEALPAGDASMMDFSEAPSSDRPKAWSEIWSSGQGINAVKQVVSAAELIERLEAEYHAARHRLALER